MLARQKLTRLFLILASAHFLGWVVSVNRADEPSPQQEIFLPPAPKVIVDVDAAPRQDKDDPSDPAPAKNGEPPAAKQEAKESDDKTEKSPSKKSETGKGAANGAAGKKFDPAVVSAGMAAFQRSCTTCHDAARSLERTKDLAGWRATVRRMAAKRGADVAAGDIEPIAVYLASRSAAPEPPADKDKAAPGDGASAGGPGAPAAAKESDASSVSTFATISPQWRGGNDNLQNSGFAPLAWVGANWQSKMVSGRVTVCVACHGVQEPAYLSRFDLVEAAVRVDLSEFLNACSRGLKGGIDAGRLMVPFGAFSAQTNPGTYRTVSTPLIFNMGQRLYNRDIGDPVLPMPYTDTGVNLNFDVPLCDLGSGPITATVDGYLVNGLVGGSNGIDFLQSRNLMDNNNHAVTGGRFTAGDPYIRAGASYIYGRFDDPNDSSIQNAMLHYRIYGFDLQARYKRLFRCQFEYARRGNDRLGVVANELGEFTEKVDGFYLEAEVRPWDECKVSFLARHDFMRRASPLPPPASTLPAGVFNVERITFGVNIELWHQSLLMFNVERWLLPEPAQAVNVFGVRYTVTF
jgi:hypothetical protein